MVSVSTMEIDRERLLETAIVNVRDIVTHAIEFDEPHKALVIYDTQNGLTELLTDAYRAVLPTAQFVDFDTLSKESILELCDALSPQDLVVLIQTSDFRLNEFRIRIHLFQQKLKVIDHLHLYRNTPDTWEVYINALAYDPLWYRCVGKKLKAVLEETNTLVIRCPGTELVVTGGVETPKLNIGDYTGMENIGGTYPIGEVFTEAKDLSQMNGSLMIYAFAGENFEMTMHEPFRVDIKDGLVVGWAENAPALFPKIVAQVQSNERAIIREIGFGLNRAITRDHYLNDITAFERMLGLHFSLGEKHTVYKKQGITPDKTRYHVDLFPLVDEVMAENKVIFKNNEYFV